MTTWTNDRPGFLERIAALAGGTTFRLPGKGGSAVGAVPDAHAVAAALAYARQGPADIGPDVAYCWAVQTDAYRRKVVRLMVEALGTYEFRNVRAYRLQAVEHAWDALIWGRTTPRPVDAPSLYDVMVMVAGATMEAKAWDALAQAERMYSRSECDTRRVNWG